MKLDCRLRELIPSQNKALAYFFLMIPSGLGQFGLGFHETDPRIDERQLMLKSLLELALFQSIMAFWI